MSLLCVGFHGPLRDGRYIDERPIRVVAAERRRVPTDIGKTPAELSPTMSEKTGTFLVTHADEGSAVLRDVEDSQVHTLSSNPGVEADDVVTATIAPDPPLEVTWQVIAVEERRAVDLVDSDLSPTQQAVGMAEGQAVGDLVREERAGTGEIHVLKVPEGTADEAAQDVLEDEATLARAARLDAVRVEVRSADGIVNVRYLPE